MKKLIIVILSFVFVSVASAQKVVHGGGYYRPHTVIVGGYAPMYPYYGFYGAPFYGYPPYGYGYNNSYSRPSKLDMQVEDIRHDYSDRIKSVKMDDSLTRKERKAKVRELKQERDNAIYDAKKSYYKS